MVVKLYFGYIYTSKALFADGIHSLLDVSADLFVLYAISVAKLPKDNSHPYGYMRYETLANIIVSLILLIASYAIIHDAILGFSEVGGEINWVVGLVAVFSLLLNEVSYQYVSREAKRIESDLLMSTAVHQRADAATSLIVLLATFASQYDIRFADLMGAISIAIMIAYYAVPSLLRSINELLDRGIDEVDLIEIRDIIDNVPGVWGHHLLRSRLMAEKGLVDVHVVVDSRISVSEGHYIGDMVEKRLLQSKKLKDVMVHIDVEHDEDIQTNSPSRSEVEAWLSAQGCNYTHIILHYLNRQIEVDIYMNDQETFFMGEKPKWLAAYRLFYAIK